MIGAEMSNIGRLARRLSIRARRLGEAAAERRRRALIRDPIRWRRADLLWPLFGKGR